MSSYTDNKRSSKFKFIRTIYYDQKKRCRKKNIELPKYNLIELIDWFFDQSNFTFLFDNWVKSSYDKNLVPSIDRLDNSKTYSLDNIRLVTWEDNNLAGNIDKRQPVLQFSLSGNLINEFKSISEANLTLKRKSKDNLISLASKGINKHAFGFIWIFKDDFSKKLLKNKIELIKEQFGVCYMDDKGMIIYNNTREMSEDLIKKNFKSVSCTSLFRKIHDPKNKNYFFYKDKDKYI